MRGASNAVRRADAHGAWCRMVSAMLRRGASSAAVPNGAPCRAAAPRRIKTACPSPGPFRGEGTRQRALLPEAMASNRARPWPGGELDLNQGQRTPCLLPCSSIQRNQGVPWALATPLCRRSEAQRLPRRRLPSASLAFASSAILRMALDCGRVPRVLCVGGSQAPPSGSGGRLRPKSPRMTHGTSSCWSASLTICATRRGRGSGKDGSNGECATGASGWRATVREATAPCVQFCAEACRPHAACTPQSSLAHSDQKWRILGRFCVGIIRAPYPGMRRARCRGHSSPTESEGEKMSMRAKYFAHVLCVAGLCVGCLAEVDTYGVDASGLESDDSWPSDDSSSDSPSSDGFSATECVPDCAGRECGPDPICGEDCGACGDGEVCNETVGQCFACVPDCSGRECGVDPLCGVSCGTCSGNESCDETTGQCTECVPDCAGRECGPDPICGASCGSCGDGLECDDSGLCVESCVPDCSGRECGVDPECGVSCGTCGPGTKCDEEAGVCEPQGHPGCNHPWRHWPRWRRWHRRHPGHPGHCGCRGR